MKLSGQSVTRRQLLIYTGQASIGIGTVGALWAANKTRIVNKLFHLDPETPAKKIYPAFQLRDISQKAGVNVTHHKVLLDAKLDNIMPWMASVGAATAAADYNKDGFIDIFVSSSGRNTPCHLFRNNGDGTFTDVAEAAGVANLNTEGGVMDAVWGDFDNDGWPDLYVVKWSAPNLLFRNNHDGTFTDITTSSGTGDIGNGNSAIWFDYNGDGHLDLYIGNYFRPVDLWHLETTLIMHNDFEKARNAGPNVLYRNNGDGTFTNVAHELGVDDTGWTLDVGACDLFNSGHMDLYLANDFGQDVIYKNNGDGTFTNVTQHALPTDTRKGMSVDFADLDGDGYPDIYVSNVTRQGYLVEGNFLWHNNRDGTFTDHAPDAGVTDGGWSWGAKFVDLDNDGEMEIIVLNGFVSAGNEDYWYFLGTMATTPGIIVEDAKNWPPIGNKSISSYETSRLFAKQGGDHYAEIAVDAGMTDLYDGRGLCVADFDNDGLPELFVANQGAPFLLYKNYPKISNHWVGFQLIGSGKTNRDAIGARVTITAGKRNYVKWVDPGSGFSSQSDRRLIFGLGALQTVDAVEIRWPNGQSEHINTLSIDRYNTFTQGE